MPFTRIVFLWGEPINVSHVKSEKEIEEMRAYLERILIELTDEADKIACGK